MNKAFLIGNLTKDPELRTTSTGLSVCSFSIAVNRKFVNQQGVREADFFNIVSWRGTAENCAKYLTKGKKVSIIGTIQNRSYDAQDGTKRYITEIIAEGVEFLSPLPSNNIGSSQAYSPAVSEGIAYHTGIYDNEDTLPF